MTSALIQLVVMLGLILLASELFTNALEHIGARLGISEGVTGSIFAAVGTALPETMVPLLAVLAGSSNAQTNEEVGVGAILGAPLMLSTLSTCLMAVSVTRSRGWTGAVTPERSGLLRDLHFFLFAFALAAVAMFIPPSDRAWRIVISCVLVATYGVYLALTLRASEALVESGHATEAERRTVVSRLGLPENALTSVLQLLAALALLVFAARGFIEGVETVASALRMSPLLLSLLIIPIATELPEKVNSIVWVRRGKDTLAFGNITGAMVFQGTLLPALGILLTPWEPRREVLSGVLVTLCACAWLRLNARTTGLPVWALLASGSLYAAYVGWTLLHT